MQFKNIAIVDKYNSTIFSDYILDLANYLRSINANVHIDCKNDYQGFTTGKLATWLNRLDLIIVVGGDGTLLSVARNIVKNNIPIIGINQGRLGFMTDITIKDMKNALSDIIINQKFTTENRSLLHAKIFRQNTCIYESIALNDVVISRGSIGNMIEFDISISGEFVLSQKSDGVIFTTPTGSTAYALAAGGAIIHPYSNVFSIVPICPQSLSNRPIIINDDVEIEFTLVKDNSTQIHFDGQECFALQFQDFIVLTKYTKKLQLIHPTGYNYYRTLRKKLDWSKRVS